MLCVVRVERAVRLCSWDASVVRMLWRVRGSSFPRILEGCLSFFFFKQKTAYEIGLGIPAEPLFRSYIDHAAFLGTINPDTNKIPKHLFQGYLNIYNNYFKAPWMPDRTEANPNELNQDDARYGFRCCHL